LIKVIDFGISKQLGVSGELPVTHANEVVGSPNYMAPEQIRAPLLVDQRADIWALGAILLELLTGRRAFPGESITAVYTRVLEGEPDLHETAAELPAALRTVVLRCLEKDPNGRFQTVNELATALAPYAPARSALALAAIARRFDGTISESARVHGRSHQGPSSVSRLAAGFAASAPGRRARSPIVPGVLLGILLSAAGAVWFAGPERWLGDVAARPRAAAASPFATAPSSPAAMPVRGSSQPTPAHVPPSPPDAAVPSEAPVSVEAALAPAVAPRVRPISSQAADSARPSVAGGADHELRAWKLASGDGAPKFSDERDPRAHSRASSGLRQAASGSESPPTQSHAAKPDAAKPSAPPAPARASSAAPRNPWDVSTFGGRS
jgi:hypothetical protein